MIYDQTNPYRKNRVWLGEIKTHQLTKFFPFRMLYAFVQQQQQEKAGGLCIIYTVGGLIRDKNGNLVRLLPN